MFCTCDEKNCILHPFSSCTSLVPKVCIISKTGKGWSIFRLQYKHSVQEATELRICLPIKQMWRNICVVELGLCSYFYAEDVVRTE